MASSTTSKQQLGELLQEQQEPFVLEVYLLERGCIIRNNNLNSETSFRCCSSSSSSISSTFLKRSSASSSWGSGLNKRSKVIPNCSNIVKTVFNKLVSSSISSNNTQKVKKKNSVNRDGNSIGRSNQLETADQSDRFSSASNTTVFNSCSESDIDDGPNSSQKYTSISSAITTDTCLAFRVVQEKEVVNPDRKLQWRCSSSSREDNHKELSPVSVLEEITSNEDSPVHDNRIGNNGKRSRDSKLTVPIIVQSSSMDDEPSRSCSCSSSGVTETKGLACRSDLHEYLTSKSVMQQSKQLLFDCVRELVERRQTQRQRQQLILGPEELSKLLCEDMKNWSKLSDTTQLLNLDFAASIAEWSDFEAHRREIGAEIGDAILENISKEIVADIVGPQLCPPYLLL